MTQPRTHDVDASGAWTPFSADGQPEPSTGQPELSTTQQADAGDHPSATSATDGRESSSTGGHHPGWRVISGGQPKGDHAVDVLDAAVDEAIATIAEPAAPTDPAPTPAPEAAAALVVDPVKTPAQDPVETPAKPGSDADSTPRTPHPSHGHPEGENAAQMAPEEAETPHSTPAWHAFATALNPAGVLFKQQASLAEVVAYADEAPYSDNRAVRALEVGWNRAVAIPATLLLYSAAAAYKRLWRGLGTSAIGVLWIVAVHAAPADTSTVWTWIVLGYWSVSALIVPVVVTKK